MNCIGVIVSIFSGLIIFTCVTLDKLWRKLLLLIIPPSTLISEILIFASLSIDSIRSNVWYERLSSVAFIISAWEVFLVKPNIAPLVFGCQWGAPRPVSAGITITFSLSFARE